jgi:biopolymer transport protein ExbD
MIRLNGNLDRNNGLSFPDMTALLDVIFILLVFLLLTANSEPRLLDIVLPEADSGQTSKPSMQNTITLTVFSDNNRWGLDATEFTDWASFTRALMTRIASMPDAEIILAGDRDAPLQKIIQLFSWSQVLLRQP